MPDQNMNNPYMFNPPPKVNNQVSSNPTFGSGAGNNSANMPNSQLPPQNDPLDTPLQAPFP